MDLGKSHLSTSTDAQTNENTENISPLTHFLFCVYSACPKVCRQCYKKQYFARRSRPTTCDHPLRAGGATLQLVSQSHTHSLSLAFSLSQVGWGRLFSRRVKCQRAPSSLPVSYSPDQSSSCINMSLKQSNPAGEKPIHSSSLLTGEHTHQRLHTQTHTYIHT